jgi:phosphoheptose isomerase
MPPIESQPRSSVRAFLNAVRHVVAVFAEHIAVVTQAASQLLPALEQCISLATHSLQQGHKILACGNGGSAADAQHFIAELVGRYRITRSPLPGIALSADTSSLTAISNDFGFEQVFSRRVIDFREH